MRALVLSLLLVPAAVPAATLSLPVHRTSEAVAAPYYAGDVLELTLTPEAARVATGAGPTRRRETLRLGLARVDAEAGALGATFTSEFVGERAPTRGERGAIDFTRFVLVHLPEGASLETAIDRFAACPEVAHVSPIAVMPTTGFPDDSLFPAEQWLYRASTPRHDIHAPEAWDVTQGDTSIVVAIVDTGILPYHPDLGGTIAGGHGNIWINLAEQGGLPGVDDDGNGFVDDTWGWDFVTGVSPGAPGEDTEDPDDDPDDFVGHGTMVAGIVGALTDNTIGIAGVSPQVRLMALRIGWLPSGGTRPGGSVRMDFAAQAIRYATRMGASVINCSWSSDNTNGIDAALTAATRAGVAIANASGNFSSPAYLATRNDVIAVGATDSTDAYWSGTEAGTWLDLVADGVGITSTYLSGNGPDSLGYRQPAYSPLFTGTSFSSPQVAGAIALLQAQRRAQGRPPLPPMGAALRLRETGDDISAENPGQIFLVPRLDVARALTDPPGSFVTRGSALTVGPPVVLHYNTGVRRVIYATSDAHLLATDEATGDTAWCVALPANPVGALAGAEIGKGFGIGLFVGTDEGTVLGYRDDGTPLPGWPQRARNTFTVMSGGVALGDLDGDGQLDVVCGGSDGYVWAWHAGGSKLTGFPFFGASGAPSAPALANLDGQPGDEIVFTDATDVVHAVGHDGAEQWEWSGPTHILAPQILRLGHAGPLAVLLAAQGSLAAVDGAGNTVWSQPLAGTTPVECALADLDGDGSDDILVASGVAVGLSARDSTGQPIARAGWPFLPQASPDGPLVAGPLRAGAGLCVGFHTAVGFSAYDDAGQVVPAYPKPKVPGAGVFPALDDVRGDGATVVISGAAADSNLYDLDAGHVECRGIELVDAAWQRRAHRQPARSRWPRVHRPHPARGRARPGGRGAFEYDDRALVDDHRRRQPERARRVGRAAARHLPAHARQLRGRDAGSDSRAGCPGYARQRARDRPARGRELLVRAARRGLHRQCERALQRDPPRDGRPATGSDHRPARDAPRRHARHARVDRGRQAGRPGCAAELRHRGRHGAVRQRAVRSAAVPPRARRERRLGRHRDPGRERSDAGPAVVLRGPGDRQLGHAVTALQPRVGARADRRCAARAQRDRGRGAHAAVARAGRDRLAGARARRRADARALRPWRPPGTPRRRRQRARRHLELGRPGRRRTLPPGRPLLRAPPERRALRVGADRPDPLTRRRQSSMRRVEPPPVPPPPTAP